MDDLGGSTIAGANTVPVNTNSAADTTPPGEGLAPDTGEERILAYERKLNTLHAEVTALVHDRSILAGLIEKESLAIAQSSQMLTPTLTKEQSIIDVLKEVSAKEHGAQDMQQRRIYEQERWKHIEKWYAIEQEKWNIQEELESQKKRMEEHLAQHVLLSEKETALTLEIDRITIEEEKERLQLALSGIIASRIDAEGKLATLEEARGKAVAQFDTIRQTEEGIEKKEAEVETMLLSVHSLTEERSLSEERYALEKERHEVESSRWEIEDEMAQLGGSVVESEKLFGELKQKEVELAAKLAALSQKTTVAPHFSTPTQDAVTLPSVPPVA